MVENPTIRETVFDRISRLRSQLGVCGEKQRIEENFSSKQILTMSKDNDKKLKLAHKVLDVMDRPNRKTCVTLLRYNVDNPESSHV